MRSCRKETLPLRGMSLDKGGRAAWGRWVQHHSQNRDLGCWDGGDAPGPGPSSEGTGFWALSWEQLGLPGERLEDWSQRSRSSSVQDLALFPAAGTALMPERQHGKGWECSGELQGGTVAVDPLIKINVLADKDDSVPIAIISQDPARQRAARSCFLSSWRPLSFSPRFGAENEVLHSSPERPSAAWVRLLCWWDARELALMLSRQRKECILAFQMVLRQCFASSPPKHRRQNFSTQKSM